ncbi:unnamed protein product [Bursaphelenchus okinawaensis]|uniref:Uncharacterized protein n=1 Tax=Bursaphelenchus okinawaensis TaxID=465554 RepID=A0A811KKZ8_9BILA|nr:unnamed protein product [Bursaphelenchus okinawaensis]CAG9105376.1 unnamed protein product [Bursaphelenchus okinawaensis]
MKLCVALACILVNSRTLSTAGTDVTGKNVADIVQNVTHTAVVRSLYATSMSCIPHLVKNVNFGETIHSGLIGYCYFIQDLATGIIDQEDVLVPENPYNHGGMLHNSPPIANYICNIDIWGDDHHLEGCKCVMGEDFLAKGNTYRACCCFRTSYTHIKQFYMTYGTPNLVNNIQDDRIILDDDQKGGAGDPSKLNVLISMTLLFVIITLVN